MIAKAGKAPNILVDCSSISIEASAEVRQKLAEAGCKFLAAPVSGSPKVVKAGKLSVVVSGPKDAFDEAMPYINMFAPAGVSYVGEGETGANCQDLPQRNVGCRGSEPGGDHSSGGESRLAAGCIFGLYETAA